MAKKAKAPKNISKSTVLMCKFLINSEIFFLPKSCPILTPALIIPKKNIVSAQKYTNIKLILHKKHGF